MKHGDYNVGSVNRALSILSIFSPERTEFSLTEISETLGMTISTAFRLANTLESKGYLDRNPQNQKYRLGPEFRRLCAACADPYAFREAARPYLEKLHDAYNESVSLYVVKSVRLNERVCIDRIESDHPLRRVVDVGDRLPITRGAPGKLLMAYLSKKEQQQLMALDPGCATAEQLSKIRRDGYCLSVGDREEGVTGIAAPILGEGGSVIASVSMAGPFFRFHENDYEERIRRIVSYAAKISRALTETSV